MYDWAFTSSLLCLITGNNANTDNSHVFTRVPINIHLPAYLAGRWEIRVTSETLTLFSDRVAPNGNRTKNASVKETEC